MKGEYILSKKFEIAASHKLEDKKLTYEENRKIFNHCNDLHGHSFIIEILLKGNNLNNGMLINFSKLKEFFEEKIKPFIDHKHLNDILVLPTSENLAKFIYTIFKGEKTFSKLLYAIRVYESLNSYIEYKEE